MFDNLLPRDPAKRDMVILALIVVPLMVAGVTWGILGDFGEPESVATPVATPPLQTESTPTGTPAAFFIIDER